MWISVCIGTTAAVVNSNSVIKINGVSGWERNACVRVCGFVCQCALKRFAVDGASGLC